MVMPLQHTIMTPKVMLNLNHQVTILNRRTGCSEIVHYTMAYVQWMNYNQYSSHYGISAVVCSNSYWDKSLCSYIPVLRISAKCANCITTINNDDVFVACPIPVKLCMLESKSIYIYITLCVGGSKTFAGRYFLYRPASRAIYISPGKVAFGHPLNHLLIQPLKRIHQSFI